MAITWKRINAQLARVITEARRRGATQERIAENGGLQQNAISKMLANPNKGPSVETFVRAVRGCGMSLQEFFARLEQSEPAPRQPEPGSTYVGSLAILREQEAQRRAEADRALDGPRPSPYSTGFGEPIAASNRLPAQDDAAPEPGRQHGPSFASAGEHDAGASHFSGIEALVKAEIAAIADRLQRLKDLEAAVKQRLARLEHTRREIERLVEQESVRDVSAQHEPTTEPDGADVGAPVRDDLRATDGGRDRADAPATPR